MVNIKTILLPILLGGIITLWGSNVFAQTLEIKYPPLPEIGNEIRTLPQYVRYIFVFAIVLAGFIAFAALVIGGIRYLTSLGNPSKMSDAQDQIVMATFGVIILLGAYWLLNTINPQLVKLELAGESAERGIILCAGGGCSENPSGEPGIDFIRVKGSMSCIRCEFPEMKPIGSAYFFNSSFEVQVDIYRDKDFKPEPPAWTSKDTDIKAGSSVGVANGNSVRIIWRRPGVYLFAEEGCKGDSRLFTTSSATMGGFDNTARSIFILPKVEIKTSTLQKTPWAFTLSPVRTAMAVIIGGKDVIPKEKLGAVLHEKENYEGDAEVFLGGDNPLKEPKCINLDMTPGEGTCGNIVEPYCREHVRNRTSAISIFKQMIDIIPAEQMGEGVTVFANYDWNEQNPKDRGDKNRHCGPINAVTDTTRLSKGTPLWVDGSVEIGYEVIGSGDTESKLDCNYVFREGDNGKISSIKIGGNYIAVLFRRDGRGEVFGLPDRSPFGDKNLKQGNHIGDNRATHLLVIPVASK